MKKQYIYAIVALVVIAAIAGFVVYKKRKAASAGTTPLAAKQTKTFEIKKTA